MESTRNNKVLFVNDHHTRTGIGKYFFNIFDILCDMEDNRYSFHMLMQNMRRNYIAPSPDVSVQFRPFGIKGGAFGRTYDLLSYFYFPKVIPEGYSIYHISSQMMGNSVSYIYPTVITCHDLNDFNVKLNRPPFGGYLRQRSIASMTKASAIIFISRNSKDDFLSLFDYREENTAVISHAASRLFRPRDKWRSREELALPLNRQILLYVGTEAPRKNIGTLFRILHKLVKQSPDLLLVRVGKQRGRSRELIEELRLEKNVLYIDRQPEERLAKFYNAADVFVFPSLYEGFGLPVLEALQSGLSVVASDATSIPEITGDAALLHHPLNVDSFAESVQTILHDRSVREEYVKRGIERAKLFSWEMAAEKTLQVYRKVLGA